MKYLALSLLAINVVMFIAFYDDQPTATSANVTVETASLDSGFCYRLSAPERAEINKLVAAVERLGGTAQIEEHDHWVDGSNWWVVSLESTPTDLSAYRSVVPQAYPITDGPKAGHLSLGIFGSEANARRLMAEFIKNSAPVELLRYQQKAPLWHVIVSGAQVELLINRYQLEFIEKKSC